MASKKKTKKLKKKQLEIKKQRKIILSVIILVILILTLTYSLVNSDILKTKIDLKSASYISFNNSKTTDMLRIDNIEKQSNSIGKSSLNNNFKEINISGKKNTKYEIRLYNIGNIINNRFINYYLTDSNNKKVVYSNLSNTNISTDGGLVIYQGEINKNNKFKLNMWISNKYNGNTKNISYEIKVKPR